MTERQRARRLARIKRRHRRLLALGFLEERLCRLDDAGPREPPDGDLGWWMDRWGAESRQCTTEHWQHKIAELDFG